MPPPRSYQKKLKPDPFVGCPKVFGLEEKYFSEYLTDRNVALVMFYDPHCPECQRSKPHFVKAARTTNRETASYAAVNCADNPDLCRRNGAHARSLPVFKLYARGKYVTDHKNALDYQELRQFVEDTPSFLPPKFK